METGWGYAGLDSRGGEDRFGVREAGGGGMLAPCGMGYDRPVLAYPQLFVDVAWDSLRGEEGYKVGLSRLGKAREWNG